MNKTMTNNTIRKKLQKIVFESCSVHPKTGKVIYEYELFDQLIALFREEREKTLKKVEVMLKDLEVDIVEAGSFEYTTGWNECNLEWDLRISDIEAKLSELRKKLNE